MAEYIKREDVLSLKHRLHNHSKDTIELYPVYVISPDAVEKIPPADVAEVKHCTWLAIGNTGLASCKCGYITDRYRMFNFCPNCGARMDGE